MIDGFTSNSTFYAAECCFEGMNGYDVIQIRNKDGSFACWQWCDTLEWLKNEEVIMVDRKTLEQIYRGEISADHIKTQEEYQAVIM